MDLSNASDEVDQLAPSPASHHLGSHSSSTPDANTNANANAASSSHQQQQHSNDDSSNGHEAQQGQQSGNDSLLQSHEEDAGEHHELAGDDESHDHDEPMQNPNHTAGITYNGHPLSGDPLMIIDKSKIPRPYKCPFPNCDKAFYRLEQ